MGTWTTQRGIFYRVTLFCPGCGGVLARWERQIDHVTHGGVASWKALSSIQPSGRPEPTGDGNTTRRGDVHWSLPCRGRDRHGRRCGRVATIRADRLIEALDRAHRAGIHDLTYGDGDFF